MSQIVILPWPKVYFNFGYETFNSKDMTFQEPEASPKYTAFVAMYGTRVVGIFNTHLSPTINRMGASGTVVTRGFRRRGVARRLWEAAIEYHHPQKIDVVVTTDRGFTLVSRLQRDHPEIQWDVCKDGKRRLRFMPKPSLKSTLKMTTRQRQMTHNFGKLYGSSRSKSSQARR